MNVAPIPRSTSASTIAASRGSSPWRTKQAPTSSTPMITERRRPYRSATTPVGTSNSSLVTSTTVPSMTSASGPSPTTCT